MAYASYNKKVKQTGVDDMVLLKNLKNDEILDNLKKRHQNDIIYTYISDVLISVNPFKAMPALFNPEQIGLYQGKFRHELPPHVYALAETAYKNMVNNKENQCVIISGESGAGKTEASKLILQYIAAVSGKSEGVERVKSIILESNPLLEAFGNAKTVRNNNSSRFGKYFEIQFNTQGDPVGGRITNYLLEKSRVVYQAPNERNFHIFYQLCCGANAQEQEEFGLGPGDINGFHYLNQSGCYQVENVNDSEEFADTRKAMTVIGIPPDQQKSILKLIAGILWLGNICFEEAGKESKVVDENTLNFAAYLLGVEAASLNNALLYRLVQSPGSSASRRGSVYKVPQSPEQAASIRDALAKVIYDRLFSWLVQRINQAMSFAKAENVTLISVLDIFGFEIFENNGFEQFCINYVNEKLQQIFIDLTLKSEQEEYQAEGIKWEPIKYFNNKIVCDLIEETKPPGIFSVLDDTCSTTHSMESNKADEKFIEKTQASINNPHYFPRGNMFTIKHYAGPVNYSIYGFTDKNKDSLFNTLIECMQSSSDGFLRQFFPEDTKEQGNKRPTSAGSKIKKSCLELVEALKKSVPHYIRCIKPNETKKPKDFENDRVLHQVQYLGLLENIRVRRAGFAYRVEFSKFLERFHLLSKQTWPWGTWKKDDKSGCEALLKDAGIEAGQWQLGKTKVFLRHPETLFGLEEMKERKYHDAATRIARSYRSYKLRAYYAELRASAFNLLENKKERRRLSINRTFTGDYINYLNNAQLQEIMKPYNNEGGILFSDMFYKPVKKTGLLAGNAFRIDQTYVLLTAKAMYYIERVKDKKQFIMKLVKRTDISTITGVSMSQLADNYVVVHFPNNDEEMFAESNNKTEFLTVLNDQYKQLTGNNITRNFTNTIQYTINKKGQKKSAVFTKDATGKNTTSVLKGSAAKWDVSIAAGLDPSTQPTSVAKKQAAVNKNLSNAKQGQRRMSGLVSTLASAPPQAPGYERAAPVAAEPVKKGPPPPPVKKDTRPKLKALYEYSAAAGDEISFPEGATIILIQKDDSGWWTGEYNGQTGLFPGNYCEAV